MKYRNYPYYSIPEVKNLKELINFDADNEENLTAFRYERKKSNIVEVTYSQFRDDINKLGTSFYNLNYKDMHIAVIGENSYEWILTYFATVNGGNVIVPIDKELSVMEVKNILETSDSRVLVYSDTYSDYVEILKQECTDISYINMKSYAQLFEDGGKLIEQGVKNFINYDVNEEQLAAIVYTSGTTGVSKGVMLSHKNIASNAVAGCKNVNAVGTSLLILPCHHTFAFTLNVCGVILSRQTTYINKSMKNVLKDMKNAKPSYMFLVPMVVETMYKRIWATAEEKGKAKMLKRLIKVSNALFFVGIDIRRKLFKSVLEAFGGNLTWVSCGGAAIDIKYIKGFRSFGVNIINGYGITECSPIVASNRHKLWVDGSVGVVVSGTEVKIYNPNEDNEGEILVKGTGVMKGYYKNQKATEDTFIDDWFKTGDIGKYEDGILYITGRKKNVIILANGKNIYPEELELKLMSIHGIRECVVYEENGCITAEVYPEEKNLEEFIREEVEIINHSIPAYKRIQNIKFRENEFPKTTTKKIKRS